MLSPRVWILGLVPIGAWLTVNGAAIEGISASPLPVRLVRGRITAKDDALYLHVFERPADGVITPAYDKPLRSATLPDPVATVIGLKSRGLNDPRR